MHRKILSVRGDARLPMSSFAQVSSVVGVNPLMRVLLGPGRFPEALRAELAADGPVVLEEGLSGSVTYRNYRAPRQRSNWKKEAASGAVAITRTRLVVFAGRMKHIDVPLAHPLRATITVAADQPDRVCFGYDAGAASSDRSGQVEVRLRTPQAARIVELLTSR